jgi:hypothetical protein
MDCIGATIVSSLLHPSKSYTPVRCQHARRFYYLLLYHPGMYNTQTRNGGLTDTSDIRTYTREMHGQHR